MGGGVVSVFCDKESARNACRREKPDVRLSSTARKNRSYLTVEDGLTAKRSDSY